MNTCTCRQPQRSMSFICKFTWTLIQAPPHPTPPHPWIHAPADSQSVACTSSANSQNVNTCPTPPHPPNVNKTPRPSKGRGPTRHHPGSEWESIRDIDWNLDQSPDISVPTAWHVESAISQVENIWQNQLCGLVPGGIRGNCSLPWMHARCWCRRISFSKCHQDALEWYWCHQN